MSKLDALCESLKITATSKWSDAALPEGWDRGTRAWKVTLRFQGRRLTVAFYQGAAHTAEPTAADVVSSLLLDASCGDQSFHDYCREFGADEDSRKAEKTWKACARIVPKIRKFLGDAYATVEKATEDH